MIFVISYAFHYAITVLKAVAIAVICYFIFTLYYGMYRYKTDEKIRKQSQYNLLNPKYALIPTVIMTILALVVFYLIWKGIVI
jgi:hypothetical protein